MAIIDQAAGRQPQPDQQPQAAPQRGPGAPPEARSVILAMYGMLYDKRVALGEKIAQQMLESRDPVAYIANTAYDLTASAVEKTKVPLDEQGFRFAMSMAMRRLAEIAQAVGIELTEEDGQAASQMMAERVGGSDPQAAAAQPQQQGVQQ